MHSSRARHPSGAARFRDRTGVAIAARARCETTQVEAARLAPGSVLAEQVFRKRRSGCLSAFSTDDPKIKITVLALAKGPGAPHEVDALDGLPEACEQSLRQFVERLPGMHVEQCAKPLDTQAVQRAEAQLSGWPLGGRQGDGQVRKRHASQYR